MATLDRIRQYLHSLSVTVQADGTLACNRCPAGWIPEDKPLWWRCPTPGCADWMDQTASPAVKTAIRMLSGSRLPTAASATAEQPPAAGEGEPAGAIASTGSTPARGEHPVRTGDDGRPAGPAVPQNIIMAGFNRLSAECGCYPADKDLADELEVSVSTIRNYRRKGYLPPRPAQ